MKTFLRLTLVGLSAVALLALLIGLLWWGNGGGIADAVHVTIDGERIVVPSLAGGGLLLALGGVLLAVVVVLVVIPVALIVGLGVPVVVLALVVALGVLALAAGLAVALAPLILPVLFVWWLVRRAGANRRASTTMAA